ncbi:hypothetical protein GOP47_0002555 [Adiantum capillus-veneris]|uniref:J domain-containing protein n=1 Tax=Adiantum capillus-veneris TaxID=13818 RepID=A0A9D4VCA8_ADICA|nr:hypothetical protein GOP47_0002555 [Adiantum capillus-veneris]
MAPSKPPAFAVCGGVSVETVVTGVGRRRSSGRTTKKSAVAGVADSLYADLLWDCGGANVENATAVGTTSSMQAIQIQDFSDVFGGPPKFASISSELSFRRGVTKVSDACSNGVFLIESTASTPSCIVQKTLGNSTPTSSPARSVKVRAITEADFSSRICHSDSDSKCCIQHKGDMCNSGKQFSSTVPSGASSRVRTASTYVRRKESFKSDLEGDTKSSSLSQSSRNDLAGMKENIEEFIKVPGSEQEGNLANVHEKMAHVLKGSQDRKQKLGRNGQHAKLRRQNHHLKMKKNSPEEHWVTIKDVQCATEPSRFPPPSRPPPELKSDAACMSKNTDKAASSIDDRQKGSGLALPKQSTFESGSLSSSSTQELNTRATYDSRVVEDAVEIAEAKIKMVLEAREKAKLMVENKLKEKRRAHQLKERSARESKPGAEIELKGPMEGLKGGKGKSRLRCTKHDVNKLDSHQLESEQTRQRDIARRCIEKATQESQNQSVSSVQERVAELRFSHNFEELREECHDAKADLNRSPAHSEPTSQSGCFWLETSGVYQKQSSCEDRSEKVVEEAIKAPRKQQQDPLSSSWCSMEQNKFDQFSSLNELDSCTHTTLDSLHSKGAVLLHGNDIFSTGFQEIMGETLERRMARWDRHCRTAARMAKALEEKKQRDLECQKEQAERHEAAEMLDEEIKIWAAGKEGNLEALLCSLHLVLWPECGWKVTSPAEFSTTVAVKKAYRRATLCVHPDKVQQRGATVAQKYVAEKVFDLLREASAIYK